MASSHRWVVRAAQILVVSSAWSVVSVAQSSARTGGPVSGTWGGEASVGESQGAWLLLFQSPQWALLAGGTDLPTAVGGYGEWGAAYFFNPHVSLGATAELAVTHRGSGGGTSFGASLARLTGAVCF